MFYFEHSSFLSLHVQPILYLSHQFFILTLSAHVPTILSASKPFYLVLVPRFFERKSFAFWISATLSEPGFPFSSPAPSSCATSSGQDLLQIYPLTKEENGVIAQVGFVIRGWKVVVVVNNFPPFWHEQGF